MNVLHIENFEYTPSGVFDASGFKHEEDKLIRKLRTDLRVLLSQPDAVANEEAHKIADDIAYTIGTSLKNEGFVKEPRWE